MHCNRGHEKEQDPGSQFKEFIKICIAACRNAAFRQDKQEYTANQQEQANGDIPGKGTEKPAQLFPANTQHTI